MKRLVAILVAGLVAGTVFGFGLGIFVYPFWFLTDVAQETLGDGAARQAVATGSFIDVNPSDPVHWGAGGVTLYREESGSAVVHLHEDFEVGPGPAFHVYLAENDGIASKADFLASARLDLGRLRAFKGSQIYGVPRGVAPGTYKSVVIWCEEFGVLISPASLTPSDGGDAKVGLPLDGRSSNLRPDAAPLLAQRIARSR